jgi:hypothetical protein
MSISRYIVVAVVRCSCTGVTDTPAPSIGRPDALSVAWDQARLIWDADRSDGQARGGAWGRGLDVRVYDPGALWRMN